MSCYYIVANLTVIDWLVVDCKISWGLDVTSSVVYTHVFDKDEE